MRVGKAAPLIGGAILLAFVIALLLVSRTSQSAVAGGPDPRLAGQWLLTKASDGRGKLDLDDVYVTLTIRPALSASGRGPCNNYTASIVGAPGPVYVTVVRRQFEQCPILSHWNLDKRYAAALKATTFANVSDAQLTLSSPHATLTYRHAPTHSTLALTGVQWIADYNNIEATDGTSVTNTAAGSVVFDTDHTFRIDTQGCPEVAGRWAQDAGEIVVSGLAHEKDDCRGLGDYRDRDFMLKAMKPGFQVFFSTYGNTLTMFEPKSGSSWQFEATQ
ncbi:MAG TPA: hypothetical protein VGI56_06120 [Galbitalea sp.]